MAKKTILKLVQEIGVLIGSDEIDSLTETIESADINVILEQTFDEVIDRKRWEFLKDRVLQLDARAGGSTDLNTLVIPSNVTRIECLKYRDTNNTVESFTSITYLQPCDFLEKVQGRNASDTNITAIPNSDGVNINVVTDAPPVYWTSFDEEIITFDGYDAAWATAQSGVGNLIQDSVIIADVVPTVDFTDPAAFLPVPQRMQTLIFNEAVSRCAINLRQTVDPKAERIARRQHIALREQAHITNKDFEEKSYGRKTRSNR